MTLLNAYISSSLCRWIISWSCQLLTGIGSDSCWERALSFCPTLNAPTNVFISSVFCHDFSLSLVNYRIYFCSEIAIFNFVIAVALLDARRAICMCVVRRKSLRWCQSGLPTVCLADGFNAFVTKYSNLRSLKSE